MRITKPEDSYTNLERLVKALGKPLFIMDLETSGWVENSRAEILEVGFLRVVPCQPVDYGYILVKNKFPIPQEVINIHGIDDGLASTGIPFEDMYQKLKRIMSGCVVSGFNSRIFDMRMFNTRCEYHNLWPLAVDQLDVRDVCQKHTKSRRGTLSHFCEKYNVPVIDAHHALGDVVMTAGLLDKLVDKLGVERVLYSLRIHPDNPFVYLECEDING